MTNLFTNKYYIYYFRGDSNKEVLGKTNSSSRLEAAKKFSSTKKLPLKEFLKIWAVEKK